MKSFIKAISYYLPKPVISNADLCKEFPNQKEADIFKKTGVNIRHIAEPDELGSDMGVSSSELLFKEHNIHRAEVDFLIYCSESFDYKAPATACVIHERLGLKKDCGAIDISLGCTGFTYSLSLAKTLIETEQATSVLIITSDTSSKVIHPEDLDLRMVFGDASASTLVCKNPTSSNETIGNFAFGTDGSGANNLIVHRSACRNVIDVDWMLKNEHVGGMPRGQMEMNGIEIFNFALRVVPPLLESILIKNKLQKEDIDLYIFHQANAFLLSVLRRKMNIPENKFLMHMSEVGNTVSASIPIVLAEAIKSGKAKKGDKILLAAFGIGYSWSGTIIVL